MPNVNDKDHLLHPVDLSDTKGNNDDKVRIGSEMTSMDPTGALRNVGSQGTKNTKVTRGALRSLEERNPYQFIEKALIGAKQ